MKRATAFLLVLACLFAVSCNMQKGNPGETDQTEALFEPETFPAQTAEHIGVTDEVMAVAGAAIHEAYPDFDLKLLDYFNIEQTHNPTRGSYLISCRLYLCGMQTYEYFGVNMSETDEGIKADSTSGSYVGEYSKYLTSCTPEKIQKAKEQIESELGNAADMRAYYLRINNDGELILVREEIYEFEGISIGTKEYSNHEHVFFQAVVCGAQPEQPKTELQNAAFTATLDYFTRSPGYPLRMTAQAEGKLKELLASVRWASGGCDCRGDFLFESEGISIEYNSAHPHFRDRENGRYGFIDKEQGAEFNALLAEIAKTADYSRSFELYQYPYPEFGHDLKYIVNIKLADELAYAMGSLNETPETAEKLFDGGFNSSEMRNSGVSEGTKWLKYMGKLYRIDPEYTRICLVSDFGSEGTVMSGLTDDIRETFRTAFECFPYNYQTVKYDLSERSFTVTQNYDGNTGIKIEFRKVSQDGSSAEIKLTALRDIENYGISIFYYRNGELMPKNAVDYKVDMKAGESAIRELTFGWQPGDSPVYIQIENSILKLILTE